MRPTPSHLETALRTWTRLGTPLAAAAALLFLAAPARAQETGPRYEVTLGFGGGAAMEKSIFNLPLDSKSSPEVLVDFRIRQRLNPNLAIGLHFYGTAETTPEYLATDQNGNVFSAKYDLAIVHVGADVRYLMLEPPFQPYFELGVNLVSGSVSEDRAGTLTLSGVSVGGGPGLLYQIGPRWGFGAQGIFTAGSASWEKRPFQNSSGTHYDPGFAGGEGFVFFRWGR